jgi:hypothetical protein
MNIHGLLNTYKIYTIFAFWATEELVSWKNPSVFTVEEGITKKTQLTVQFLKQSKYYKTLKI